MATLVVIDQPIRVDVDIDATPHAFWDVTHSDITAADWAATEEAPLEVTFADDLTAEQIDAIVRIARALPLNVPPPNVPPGTVNTPEPFQPGITSLGIKWQAVENATMVEYDVYLSATPGAYAPANFLASTAATMAISDTLPDGTPLQHGATYYWQYQPRSGDQMGPVSAEVSGTLAQVNSEDIVAEAITAELIQGGAITAEKLAALIVIAGEIATAEDGARSGISAVDGFFSYGPDGENLIFQANGGSLFVDGDINARTLNVVEGATWSGTNLGSPGASTMMGDKLSAPGSPPTVEVFWDEVTLDGGDVAGDVEEMRGGLVWQGSHWWVASAVVGGGFPGYRQPALLKFDAAGSHVATYTSPNLVSASAKLSLTLHGSTFYSHATRGSVLHRWSTSGTHLGFIALAGLSDQQIDTGVIGSDGTNLLFGWRASNTNLRWQAYDTAGATVGSLVDVADLNYALGAILGGSFDFGGSRVVIAKQTVGCDVYGVAGGTHPNQTFPAGDRGLAWNGSAFASLAGPTRIIMHTAALAGEAGPIMGWVSLAVGATWYDSAGTTHETKVSPRVMALLRRRCKHRLRTAGKVPAGGGVDDPNGARFHIGRTTARAKLQRQGVHTPGTGQYATVELSTISLPVGAADAADPPPETNSFPTGTPYRQFSEATYGIGLTPLTELRGDGTFWAMKTLQAGEVTVNITALNTNTIAPVTFTVPFDAPPAISLTVNGTTPNAFVGPAVQNLTTAGFDAQVRRVEGAAGADITISWIATRKTQ